MTKLDINNYATRKTLAQGMLDLALLTANAAQLKYILTIGSAHPFFMLLLVLVIASIVLQVLQAITIIILAILLDINKVEEQRKSVIFNNVLMCLTVLSVTINVVISAFDMKSQSKVFTSE
ncbi:ninjurin-2-like [Uranotaenia lowii]|uniref:ninjurin-2-like n=1 Tax=Uranotaenia lowii TaxID=190385 RepID=UPI002479B94B|nr:ninjurin-2-like [Uranotaenia lowii]